jgi:hypothetical protein
MKDTMDKTLFVIATWEMSRIGGYCQVERGVRAESTLRLWAVEQTPGKILPV